MLSIVFLKIALWYVHFWHGLDRKLGHKVRFERGADLELLYTLKSEWYCYRDAYRRIEDWAEQNLPPEPTVYQEGYC